MSQSPTYESSWVTRAAAWIDARPWFAFLVLVAPFVVVLITHDFLQHHFVTTTSVDEASYHYPTIKYFAEQFPNLDFTNYMSATTPLYHVVFALFYKAGLGLQALRLLNLAISFGGVMLFRRFLSKSLGVDSFRSMLYALLFAVSPYYFGPSFVLMTDNAALILALACLFTLHAYRKSNRTTSLILALVLAEAALLTRQIYAALVLVIILVVLTSPSSTLRKTLKVGAALFALVPLVMLFVLWNGPTPPEFVHLNANTRFLDPTGVAMLVSIAGLYALFLGSSFFREHDGGLPRAFVICAAIFVVIWLVLAFFPITPFPRLRDGYLWRLSTTLPLVNKTGLPYFVLLPIGVCFLIKRARALSWNHLALLGLIAVAIGSLRSSAYFQKYYDPIALCMVIWLVAQSPWRTRLQRALPIGLLVVFVAFHFVRPVRQDSIPPSIRREATLTVQPGHK